MALFQQLLLLAKDRPRTRGRALHVCYLSSMLILGCGGSDEIERLIGQVQTGDADARYEAAKELERISEEGGNLEAALPALIAALQDSQPRVRYRATKVMAKVGSAAALAVPALAQVLEDPDPQVRYYAAKALYELGPLAREATASLVRTLHDKSADVRYYSTKACAKIGPPAAAAVPRLRELARTGDSKLREAATKALTEIRGS